MNTFKAHKFGEWYFEKQKYEKKFLIVFKRLHSFKAHKFGEWYFEKQKYEKKNLFKLVKFVAFEIKSQTITNFKSHPLFLEQFRHWNDWITTLVWAGFIKNNAAKPLFKNI